VTFDIKLFDKCMCSKLKLFKNIFSGISNKKIFANMTVNEESKFSNNGPCLSFIFCKLLYNKSR